MVRGTERAGADHVVRNPDLATSERTAEPELAPWVTSQSGLTSVPNHQKNLEGREADIC